MYIRTVQRCYRTHSPIWTEQHGFTRISTEIASFRLLKSWQSPSITLLSPSCMEQSSSCFLKRWIWCRRLSSTLLNSSWRLLKCTQQKQCSEVVLFTRFNGWNIWTKLIWFLFPHSTYIHTFKLQILHRMLYTARSYTVESIYKGHLEWRTPLLDHKGHCLPSQLHMYV